MALGFCLDEIILNFLYVVLDMISNCVSFVCCLLMILCLVFSFLQVDEGWWLGECHGKFGLFPANYVQVQK